MSNLSDILGGIETVLEAQTTGLQVYKYPPDSVNRSPAVLILPTDTPFEDIELTLGGNSFRCNIILTILIQSGDPESGWTQLIEAIDTTVANTSIIRALRTDLTLNGKADGSQVFAVRNIGRRSYNEQSYYGADILLRVWKQVA